MSEPATREAATRLTVRRLAGAALTLLSLTVVTFAISVVGGIVGVVARNAAVGITVRGLLVVLAVATLLTIGYRVSRGGPRWLWIVVGALGYVAHPGSWTGRAVLANLFDLWGNVAQGVDLILWMAVVLAVVLTRPDMSDERIDISRLR